MITPVNQDFMQQLRNAGLRVTKPRITVLEEISEHPHTSAESLRRKVAQRLGTVSTQAIYDVLHTLTAKGLLRKIQPSGSVPLYEISAHDNHHHLVCRTCGKIVNIMCVVGETPCLHPQDDHGFIIDEAEVIFWGLCPECANNTLPQNERISQ